MSEAALVSWSAWWDSVPPDFAFLLALPFAVAALGLLGDAVRRRVRAGP